MLNKKQRKKSKTKMKKHITKTLPKSIATIVIYQSKKMSTRINVRDKTELYHQLIECAIENVSIKDV